MALYLSMDGIDDRLQLPSMTFTEVVVDMSAIRSTSSTKLYIDARTGVGFTYLQSNTNGTDSWSGFNNVYVDGVSKSNNTVMIPNNQRCLLRVVKTTAGTDDLTIFAQNSGAANTYVQGSLYDVKIYNGTTLQAHYNMTTGTVIDQSGNGRHATLTGGTWLDDGTGGGSGTDGSTAFDLRQSLFADGAVNADSRQSFYSDSFTTFDSIQAIYSDSATGYDTRFNLYQDSAALFDTLQEFFSDGLVGSTPFDLRLILYADSSAVFDSRQAVYDDGLLRADLSQQLYDASQLNADMKLVLYSDTIVNADMALRTYTDGTVDFDTLQSLLEEWAEYNEVIRIVLNISRKQSATLDVTQRMTDTLDITQSKQSELNL